METWPTNFSHVETHGGSACNQCRVVPLKSSLTFNDLTSTWLHSNMKKIWRRLILKTCTGREMLLISICECYLYGLGTPRVSASAAESIGEPGMPRVSCIYDRATVCHWNWRITTNVYDLHIRKTDGSSGHVISAQKPRENSLLISRTDDKDQRRKRKKERQRGKRFSVLFVLEAPSKGCVPSYDKSRGFTVLAYPEISLGFFKN